MGRIYKQVVTNCSECPSFTRLGYHIDFGTGELHNVKGRCGVGKMGITRVWQIPKKCPLEVQKK